MTYLRQPPGNGRARIVRKGNGDELEIAAVTSLKGPTGSRWAANEEAQAKEESIKLGLLGKVGKGTASSRSLNAEAACRL
jgi:hypothetical protein